MKLELNKAYRTKNHQRVIISHIQPEQGLYPATYRTKGVLYDGSSVGYNTFGESVKDFKATPGFDILEEWETYNLNTNKMEKEEKDLTVYSSELHERQKKLEKDILDLILAFNKDTNLLPRSITLETSDLSGIRDNPNSLKKVTLKRVITYVPLSY